MLVKYFGRSKFKQMTFPIIRITKETWSDFNLVKLRECGGHYFIIFIRFFRSYFVYRIYFFNKKQDEADIKKWRKNPEKYPRMAPAIWWK